MNCACVVVVDAARARFLVLELAPDDRPSLVEQKDLINPESDVKGRDLWSDPKTGRGRESRGTPAHGYDDHRDAHAEQFKRRFAGRVVEQALSLALARGAGRLIVAADRKMLGHLRPFLGHAPKNGLEIREVPKDLTKLSASELQERLAEEALIPSRRSAPAQRGQPRR
jgi:protein required for attachment to host cells